MANIHRPLALLTFALFTAACGQSPAPEGDGIPAAAPGPTQAIAKAAENLGSVDIAISGSTVGGNSKQCELNFQLANNSTEDVRNFYVEFEVSNAATGEVLRADEPLVIPGTIRPGASGAPFGPVYVNGLGCAEVRLKPLDLAGHSCKENCAPYLYTATDIAGLQP